MEKFDKKKSIFKYEGKYTYEYFVDAYKTYLINFYNWNKHYSSNFIKEYGRKLFFWYYYIFNSSVSC